MANVFDALVKQLISLGFYDFLFPFIITAAIFYGLLRKSKILSDSPLINGVIALSIAFMVFGFPTISGISLSTPLSTFFTQATVWVLIFLIGFILASFFYPELSKMLLEQFTRRSTLMIMISIGITLFVVSGLLSAIFIPPSKPPAPGTPASTPTDVIIITAGVIIFIVLIIIAAAIARSRE